MGNIPWSVCEEQPCAVGIRGRGLVPRDLRGSLSVDEAFHLKLQHRLVLELLMDSFTGSKTYTIEFLIGQRTPTAKSVHQCNLSDHQHEATKPALYGVHAADLLSDGGSCKGFNDTLEDDHAKRTWRLMACLWVSTMICWVF